MRTSLALSLMTASALFVLGACAATDSSKGGPTGPQFDDANCPDGGTCSPCAGDDVYVDAGSNQQVPAGTLVQLNGQAEDSQLCTGGAPFPSVSWSQIAGPSVTLTGGNTLTPTFTAPWAATVLTFRLTASGTSGTYTDAVSITVTFPIADQFARLVDLINNANLEKNTAKSLLSLLQNAQASYGKGDIDGALDKLNSFVSQVSALKKKIPDQDVLIDAATALINAITQG